MITYLKGQPVIEKDGVTILVGGVGYGVRVSQKTQQRVADALEAELFIYTHVREEALDLYGFCDRQEREIFLLLLDVSGVGPRTALVILNTNPAQVIEAVQQADDAFFSAIPRVGKKLAQKIIIELRTKLGELKQLNLAPASPKYQDVVLALQSLGFSESSINQVLQSISVEELSTADAVTQAIKLLGQKLPLTRMQK